ncbi:MBL fold metallo-hydrolase [Halobacillus fulvus]|nr:MBL fold metallo-hydrolase [Halobacillus fulvus]
MKITQIRNATLLVEYAESRFLVDPFFADKGSMPPFENTENQDLNNPLVDLPEPKENWIDVEAVFVTHLHPDHFDETAKKTLPKQMKIFAQNEEDKKIIEQSGFKNVETFENGATLGGVKVVHTGGRHGTGDIGEKMGTVSGLVFTHPDEKTLYIAGDTVWCGEVETAIETHRPEMIVVNGGAAQFLDGDPITMTKEDIQEVHLKEPESMILVSHMEALNHCLLKKDELQIFLEEKGINNKVKVPEDGEIVVY